MVARRPKRNRCPDRTWRDPVPRGQAGLAGGPSPAGNRARYRAWLGRLGWTGRSVIDLRAETARSADTRNCHRAAGCCSTGRQLRTRVACITPATDGRLARGIAASDIRNGKRLWHVVAPGGRKTPNARMWCQMFARWSPPVEGTARELSTLRLNAGEPLKNLRSQGVETAMRSPAGNEHPPARDRSA